MPNDAEILAALNDEPAPAAKPQEQTTEQVETTEVTDAPEAEPNPSDELWAKVAPDLADSIKDLSPEARERILLNRLAANAEQKDTPATSVKEVANDAPNAGGPSASEVPTLDYERMTKTLSDIVGEQEGPTMMKEIFDPTLRYVHGVAARVIEALGEYDKRFTEYEGKLSSFEQPRKFQSALPNVRGAVEADIAKAQQIYASGEAKTELAALKLAVYERQAELDKAKGAKPASEDARRRAQAIAASDHTGSSRKGGVPEYRIPTTVNDLADLMRAEESRK